MLDNVKTCWENVEVSEVLSSIPELCLMYNSIQFNSTLFP